MCRPIYSADFHQVKPDGYKRIANPYMRLSSSNVPAGSGAGAGASAAGAEEDDQVWRLATAGGDRFVRVSRKTWSFRAFIVSDYVCAPRSFGSFIRVLPSQSHLSRSGPAAVAAGQAEHLPRPLHLRSSSRRLYIRPWRLSRGMGAPKSSISPRCASTRASSMSFASLLQVRFQALLLSNCDRC